MEQVHIGFIGAGGIAQRHFEVLRGFHDVKIVAFADPLLERALTLSRRCNANAYEDYRVMLDQEPVDALYICVPPFAHGPFEMAAVERGLPFFVEKPLGTSWETAARIAQAIEAKGLITGVGYHWRYMTTVDEAKALVAQHPPQLVVGYWLDRTPPPGWWVRDAESGGQMVEQTTHIFDLARYLVGEAESVFALGAHYPRPDFPDADIFETTTAAVRFASGALGSINSTCVLNWQHRVGLHLFGEGQVIEISEFDAMIDVGHGRPVSHSEGDPVVREDRDFIDAVLGMGNRIRVPYAEALKTLGLTLAATRSAKEGREITLKDELAYV
jgi:predicted dehydrogenase